jgi:hypothetical protein
MAKLKPGDCINCCIKDYYLVSPYHEYDEVLTFEVVAESNFGYYVYVPHYITLNNLNHFSESQCKFLGIDRKFYGQNFLYVKDSFIYRVKSVQDGMTCHKCQDFFLMAEANQEDGTLICYACRQNPYR